MTYRMTNDVVRSIEKWDLAYGLRIEQRMLSPIYRKSFLHIQKARLYKIVFSASIK